MTPLDHNVPREKGNVHRMEVCRCMPVGIHIPMEGKRWI